MDNDEYLEENSEAKLDIPSLVEEEKDGSILFRSASSSENLTGDDQLKAREAMDDEYMEELNNAKRDILRLIEEEKTDPVLFRLASLSEALTCDDQLKAAMNICGDLAAHAAGGPLTDFVPGRKDDVAFLKKLSDLGFNPTEGTFLSPDQIQEAMPENIFDGDTVKHIKTGAFGFVLDGEICSMTSHPFEKEEVTLVSRQFSIGDTVTRTRETNGELGVVLAVSEKVGLTHPFFAGVLMASSDQLQRFRDIYSGDLVFQGKWLGIVHHAELRALIKFSDGTETVFSDMSSPFEVVPSFNSMLERAIDEAFYHYQAVELIPENLKGWVEGHRVSHVLVDWFETGLEEDAPPDFLKRSKVTLLRPPAFVNADWSLGKRCLFKGAEHLISICHPRKVLVLWKAGNEEEIDSREIVGKESPTGFFDGDFEIGDPVRLREENPNLPYFGLVSRVTNAGIKVSWADGTDSMVVPENIVCARFGDPVTSDSDEEESEPDEEPTTDSEEEDGDVDNPDNGILKGQIVKINETGNFGMTPTGGGVLLSLSHVKPIPIQEEDITVVAKIFWLGDVVTMALEGGAIGVVLSPTKRRVGLTSASGNTSLNGVETVNLQRIREYFPGDFVFKESWLGGVVDTNLRVTVAFQDGTKLIDCDPELMDLQPCFTNSLEESIDVPFYQGQNVIFEDRTGVVESHRVYSVKVDWYDDGTVDYPPPAELSASEVSLLVPTGDVLSGQWILGCRCLMNGEEYLVSECHESKVVVLWTDGNEEEIDTREIVRVDEDVVVEGLQIGNIVRRMFRMGNDPDLPHLGIIHGISSVGYKVRWADGMESTVSRDDIDRARLDSGSDDDTTESDEDNGDDDSNPDDDGGEVSNDDTEPTRIDSDTDTTDSGEDGDSGDDDTGTDGDGGDVVDSE